jgi:thiamine-monophosphate kinase
LNSATGEFALIARHLSALGAPRNDVSVAVGDDAAILDTAPGAECCSACACVALAHGPDQCLAQSVAATIENLVVRLQDDGFTPAWATLVLTLSRTDDALVHLLAAAVHSACTAHGIAVIGGDTTAGAGSLTIFLTGLRSESAR